MNNLSATLKGHLLHLLMVGSEKMVDLGTNLIPGARVADIYATASFEVRLPIADKDIPFLGIPLDGTSIGSQTVPM